MRIVPKAGADLAAMARAAIEKNQPESGEALAEDVVAHLRRYVAIGNSEAIVVALWAIYTYLWEKFSRTPYLAVKSAERMSGKTTLLTWLRLMVPKAEASTSISPAALYRLIGKQRPTMLIDELDTIFGRGKEHASERAEALRMVLNAGFQKGGVVTICAGGRGAGVLRFDVYCPKALAAIGNLPDTIESRCIPIVMRRRAKTETVAPLDDDEPDPVFAELRARMERFAIQNEKTIEGVKVALPEAMTDRGRDLAKPLLRVAAAVSPAWLIAAEMALTDLLVTRRDDMTTGVELLRDIRVAFEERKTMVLASRRLVEALVEMDGGPWAEWSKGKAITPRAVARMLALFGIEAKTYRTSEGVVKGYSRPAFYDAWERYLGADAEEATEKIEDAPAMDDLFEKED